MLLKRLGLLVLGVASLHAQLTATRSYYTSGNLQYFCSANQNGPGVTFQKSDATLTNISVASNVGTVTTAAVHGVWPGMRFVVTGSTTTALNATYTVVTATPTATTFTITTAGVSDGTYTDAALKMVTFQPPENLGYWSILVLHYTAGVQDGTYYAGPGSSASKSLKCSDRAIY